MGRVFFARGISPGREWWWTLLGREISCSQWEGPSMHSSCLTFFFLSFGGRGGEGGGKRGKDFCSFFLGSQCVPTRLHSSSQWVPNVFPNMFFIAPHFYPICFDKCCSPFTYITAPNGMYSNLQNRTFYRSATKGLLMNSGWRLKWSFIGQINDFWTFVTNVFPQNRTCMLRMLHMCACNIKTKKKWKLAWTCNGPFWQITGPFAWKQCISCSTDGPFPKKFLKIN